MLLYLVTVVVWGPGGGNGRPCFRDIMVTVFRGRNNHKYRSGNGFLDTSSHLYNWVCLSVGRSVHWLVGDAFVKNKGNRYF